VITPLGSNVQHDLDVRFIATSRTPLEPEVELGRFRADLLYRLNVVSLRVPPLSERLEDIPALFTRLLHEACARHRLPARAPAPHCWRNWRAALARQCARIAQCAERFALGLDAIAQIAPDAGEATPANWPIRWPRMSASCWWMP
jgi:two-component system, NtrC family, C4-dicarboxylate transport response regulator DctD